MQRTRRERAALKIPPKNKSRDYYDKLNERLTAAFEEAQLKPGSLILPRIKGEDKLEQRTKDKLARQRVFLEAIREGATMGQAVKELRISRKAVDAWCERDGYFAMAFDAAKEDRADLVERAARDLATKGQEYVVASGGKVVGKNVVRSEKMIEMLLKAERPELFGDRRKVELSAQVTYSRPSEAVVMAQIRSILQGAVDLPPLLDAGEVIEGEVVAVDSPSIGEED